MTTPALPDRTVDVDALRAFALVGICVVNMPFLAMPVELALKPPVVPADQLASLLVATLAQGKFFILFSFLFGWGLFVQQRSAARSGAPFGPRHARRLLGLAGIGVAHALLVFTGDILVLYAILGAALWAVREWSPRALLRLAVAALPIAAVALVGLAFMAADMPPSRVPGLGGGFLEATATRVEAWPVAFTFVLLFNGPMALAAFAAGLAAAKTGFFDPGNPQFERLSRLVPALALLGLAINLLYGMQGAGLLFGDESLLGLLVFLGLVIGAPMLSACYLVWVVRAVRRFRPSPAWLAAGRNSLSTYVTQGILAGFAFGGYGLGWFGEVGHAAILGIALVIAALTLLIGAVCYGATRRGPLELLLRRITYGARKT